MRKQIFSNYANSILYWLIFVFCLVAGLESTVVAHDFSGHSAITYEIADPAEPAKGVKQVVLHILNQESGEPIAARFSIEINGMSYVPEKLSKEGIRFTSIHTAKKQKESFFYSRGTGGIRIQIPEDCKELICHVVKGYEYLPVTRKIEIKDRKTDIKIELQPWVNLKSEGWYATEEHIHYERTRSDLDADWATMLEADGLSHGFFMVLKGGNVPGIWAQQYAYGNSGINALDQCLLVPGEEFRGSAQGHNNLFGMAEIFEPISVGGMSKPPHRWNWPSTHEVLRHTRETGGIGGPAHGGTFGKASTVYLDAIHGVSDFVELANTHLYELGPWYELMNCGIILAPVAGTDLPNFPYRESWQPFFGETCTYVQAADSTSFEAWKQAVRAGKTFITSGPILRLSVNGKELGSTVQLPAGGGEVLVEAEISSPKKLSKLELVANGEVISAKVRQSKDEFGVHRWTVSKKLKVNTSTWIAARGEGAPKKNLLAQTAINKSTVAHTAAIPVIVGDTAIRVPASIEAVRSKLKAQQEWYRESGVFPNKVERKRFLELFDQALMKLSN